MCMRNKKGGGESGVEQYGAALHSCEMHVRVYVLNGSAEERRGRVVSDEIQLEVCLCVRGENLSGGRAISAAAVFFNRE